MSFAVNKVENLNVNFCFVLNWTFPLFCTGARLSQRTRIQEVSTWERKLHYDITMISIATSLVACLSQHFNVMISYHVGDVCKQCNHPMLLTTGDVGAQMSPDHLYMWISNGSYTHESFDSDNEYMIK